MRLTEVLFRWKKRPPRGDIWRGKYRWVKEVTPLDTALKREAFKLEERNMFYLRHPYLTVEQIYDHATPSNDEEQSLEKPEKKWRDNVLLGDRFGFLKVSDKWE